MDQSFEDEEVYSEEEESITTEEIKVTLVYLKKRFPQYSLEKILFDLSKYVANNQRCEGRRYQERHREERRGRQLRSDSLQRHRDDDRYYQHYRPEQRRGRRPSIQTTRQERILRAEQLRLVAKFFCSTGYNHSLIRQVFPYMSNQQYRCHVDSINNHTIYEVQHYLRYQCNIQVQHMSPDQKRSLKTKLLKVSQWLGRKSTEQLATYYKFIERSYFQNEEVELEYNEVLNLYKTLLETAKSPYVDVSLVHRNMAQMVHNDQQEVQLSKTEEKAVIRSYLQLKNISKVGQAMCDQFAYSSRWSHKSIRDILRANLKRSLVKLFQSCKKHLKNRFNPKFGYSDSEVALLFESENSFKEKKALLQFAIHPSTTLSALTQLVKLINDFYSRESHNEDQQDEEVEILPKIESQRQRREQQKRKKKFNTINVEETKRSYIAIDEEETAPTEPKVQGLPIDSFDPQKSTPLEENNHLDPNQAKQNESEMSTGEQEMQMRQRTHVNYTQYTEVDASVYDQSQFQQNMYPEPESDSYYYQTTPVATKTQQ